MHAMDARNDTLASSGLTGRFVLLCMGVWLHSADTLVTATIAPDIVADLHGIAYINWTISLYEVGAIITGAATAALCARFGIRGLFVGACGVYGGGCVLGALAPNMAVLIVGTGHGPMVRNGAMTSAGDAVTPACVLGQIA